MNLGAVVEKVEGDRREITPIMSWARRNNPFGGTLGREEREPANTINNNLTPTAKSSPEGPGRWRGVSPARREGFHLVLPLISSRGINRGPLRLRRDNSDSEWKGA